MRSSRGSLPERSGAPLLHARTRRVSAQRSDDSRDPAGLRDGRLVLRVASEDLSERKAATHLHARIRRVSTQCSDHSLRDGLSVLRVAR